MGLERDWTGLGWKSGHFFQFKVSVVTVQKLQCHKLTVIIQKQIVAASYWPTEQELCLTDSTSVSLNRNQYGKRPTNLNPTLTKRFWNIRSKESGFKTNYISSRLFCRRFWMLRLVGLTLKKTQKLNSSIPPLTGDQATADSAEAEHKDNQNPLT